MELKIILLIIGVVFAVAGAVLAIIGIRPYVHRYDKLRDFCEKENLPTENDSAVSTINRIQNYVKERCNNAKENFCVSNSIVSGCVNTHSELGVCAVSSKSFFYNILPGSVSKYARQATGVSYRGKKVFIKFGSETITLEDYIVDVCKSLERAEAVSYNEISLQSLMYFNAKYNSGNNRTDTDNNAHLALRKVKNSVVLCVNKNGTDSLTEFEAGDINTALSTLRKMIPTKEYK